MKVVENDLARKINLKGLLEKKEDKLLAYALNDFIIENNEETLNTLIKNDLIDIEKDINGYRLIHIIAEKGSPNLLKLLIEKGADINCRDKDGKTALHYTYTSLEKTKLLVENGIDIDIKDNEGLTPYTYAYIESVKNENADKVASYLLEKLYPALEDENKDIKIDINKSSNNKKNIER